MDRREMRPRVRREGHHHDILLAGGFDLAAGDHAARVRAQHDLQHYARVVGGRARRVVGVSGVYRREIELVVDDVAQRVLESARKDLLLERDRDELTLGVFYGLVARHREASVLSGLDFIDSVSPEGINLQLQRKGERRRLSRFLTDRRPLCPMLGVI